MKINNGYPCNPYLPSKEYIPDGEPKVFGNRIYVYGSHDEFGASGYCTGSYAGWSAPVDAPAEWRYEGIILEKGQDPLDPEGKRSYYAPDVVQGADGRFYLYYSIEDSCVISVAVCDTPAGKYRFLGHVKDRNGHVLGSTAGDAFQFDPAVLVDEDGRIYLYSGQGMPVEEIEGRKVMGAQVCELEPDMVTMKTSQKVITSRQENCFTENPFFEAPSIRKFEGKYYFIYSPLPNVHTLCYAVSDAPDREFRYQGVLVSNGDLFPENAAGLSAVPKCYWGNNHGSILQLGGAYFVFYHRHTNRCAWSRQGCVERLERNPDGSFRQAHITSLGFRQEAFPTKGEYGAYIACILQKREPEPYQPYQFYEFTDADPYLTQEENTHLQFIANLRNGCKAGYRYFDLDGKGTWIFVKYRGSAEGEIIVMDENTVQLACIPVSAAAQWQKASAPLAGGKRTCELTFTYRGTGVVDLLSFGFEE